MSTFRSLLLSVAGATVSTALCITAASASSESDSYWSGYMKARGSVFHCGFSSRQVSATLSNGRFSLSFKDGRDGIQEFMAHVDGQGGFSASKVMPLIRVTWAGSNGASADTTITGQFRDGVFSADLDPTSGSNGCRASIILLPGSGHQKSAWPQLVVQRDYSMISDKSIVETQVPLPYEVEERARQEEEALLIAEAEERRFKIAEELQHEEETAPIGTETAIDDNSQIASVANDTIVSKSESDDISGKWAFTFTSGKSSNVCNLLSPHMMVIDNEHVQFRFSHPKGSTVGASGHIENRTIFAYESGDGYFMWINGNVQNPNLITGSLKAITREGACRATWDIRRMGSPALGTYRTHIDEFDATGTTGGADVSSESDGDMLFRKLSKIKSWVDSGLISEDEALEKRRELLDAY